MTTKEYRAGIIGASGYGGNELVRLLANHPEFTLSYVAGESTAGMTLSQILPWVSPADDLIVGKIDQELPEELHVVFISLPSGASRPIAARIGENVKIIDVGEDHRFADGWEYGLADIWPDKIRGRSRIANPGCYPTAVLTALAPLLGIGIGCDPKSIVVSAISGVSGAGRGGGKTMGFADVNEDASAYKLAAHSHTKEMGKAIAALSGSDSELPPVFVPHLAPMTRGILATCFIKGSPTAEMCITCARRFYADRPFVRISDAPVHSKWATGSNLVFVTYAKQANGTIVAVAAIDNLGKGAASQAVQNANLMFGLDPTTGLTGAPLIP